MFIKKDFRYLERVYKAWAKTTRMMVIQLMPGNKKAGESVGRNIVDYNSLNQRGIEPYNLATRIENV